MKPRAAKTLFLKRLEAAGLALDSLTPAVGVEAMLAFYVEERADGCPLDEDGDMLLFQWGTNDWGQGHAFEVNITRQLIESDGDEDEPRQLSLTFRFGPSRGAEVREGNRWCESPDAIVEFRRFLGTSMALKAVGKMAPDSAELRFGRT